VFSRRLLEVAAPVGYTKVLHAMGMRAAIECENELRHRGWRRALAHRGTQVGGGCFRGQAIVDGSGGSAVMALLDFNKGLFLWSSGV
jgi:hypothetical protein